MPRAGSRSAHVSEGLAHLAHEDLGYLEGGEVAAALELAEVDQTGEALLRPAPRGAEDLLREDGASRRHRDRIERRRPEALPVETGRRGGRPRQPVEHDVVEELVAREHVLRV